MPIELPRGQLRADTLTGLAYCARSLGWKLLNYTLTYGIALLGWQILHQAFAICHTHIHGLTSTRFLVYKKGFGAPRSPCTPFTCLSAYTNTSAISWVDLTAKWAGLSKSRGCRLSPRHFFRRWARPHPKR